jgi:ribosomal protein L32
MIDYFRCENSLAYVTSTGVVITDHMLCVKCRVHCEVKQWKDMHYVECPKCGDYWPPRRTVTGAMGAKKNGCRY